MAPSIKGVLLTKLVDDVRALLERREADRERLEACLSAGSLFGAAAWWAASPAP